MLGLVIILFIPALLSAILMLLYNNKQNAKSLSGKLNTFFSNTHNNANAIIPIIIKENNFGIFEGFISKKVDIFLIESNDGKIKVYTSNKQQKIISLKQFHKIIEKANSERLVSKYDLDSVSVYYYFEKPYNNYVLWLNSHGKRF